MLNPVPTAALAVMAYGDPATVAVAAVAALASVTDVTVSPFTNPASVNSVPAKVKVEPYDLL